MASLNATTSSGIVVTSDNTGTLQLQSAGTTVANITSTGLAVTGALTTNGLATSPYTMKNRIINGDMQIDQRNNGAAVSGTPTFPVDRFRQSNNGGGVLQGQQVSDAPAGFSRSVRFTVTTIDSSIAAGEYYQFEHFIEGFNTADLNWGTANAQTVTLSFWAKASQIGTYSVALANDAGDRSYPSFYTILAANTWEYKTITIPGSTSGTWFTTNGCGIGIRFGIVYGSTFNGATPNAWMNTSGFANAFITSTNNMMSTLNATLQMTGVQLEIGSQATSFEWLPYGTELALCQRYFQQLGSAVGVVSAANFMTGALQFFVPMRTSPTLSVSAPMSVTDTNGADWTQSSAQVSIVSGNRVNNLGVNFSIANFSGMPTNKVLITIPTAYSNGIMSASAEL